MYVEFITICVIFAINWFAEGFSNYKSSINSYRRSKIYIQFTYKAKTTSLFKTPARNIRFTMAKIFHAEQLKSIVFTCMYTITYRTDK